MFDVKGISIHFEFQIEEVLNYYDGPKSFFCSMIVDDREFLAYAHYLDENKEIERILFVPINDEIFWKIKKNYISLQEVFKSQKNLFLADIDLYTPKVYKSWMVELSSIPSDHLPEPGVFLFRT